MAILDRHGITVAEATINGRTALDILKEAFNVDQNMETGDARAQAAIGQTLRRYNHERERYVKLAIQIAERFEELAHAIAADPTRLPNSLGELQGRTSEIEGCGAGLNILQETIRDMLPRTAAIDRPLR